MGKTVLCHGVFDVLHAGHLSYFESAKKFGDTLIVSVTSDRFVAKGPNRPHFPASVRVKMLQSLKVVDTVVLSDSETAVDVINMIKPDFYVKGPDYNHKITGNLAKERDAVESNGGKLVFTDDPLESSSQFINRFFNNWTDEQNKIREAINGLGGLEAIKKCFDKVASLHVKIIGENIIDKYVFCLAEGVSSKSPSLSARYGSEKSYAGGVAAIQNHVAEFVKDTSITSQLHPITKTRFISGNTRLLELTHIDEDVVTLWNPTKTDTTLVADFGHGLIHGELLGEIERMQGFVALNVQTNSSNFGFNPYTKHKRFDYLSLDTREARIAHHDKHSKPLDLAKKIKANQFSMTMGADGAYFYSDGDCAYSPAFTSNVVDAMGAGDAYFAVTSLLTRVSSPPEIVVFVGNVFAGLKAESLGQTIITKEKLLRTIESILK